MLIECANCGAPLHAQGNAQLVICNYCSRQNRIQNTRMMAQQTPQGWQPPPAWTPPPHMPAPSVQLQYHVAAARSQFASMFWIIGLVSVTIVGAVGFFVLGAVNNGGSSLGAKGSGPGSGGVTPAGEHMQWHSNGPPPMPVDFNGDGVEDIVGFFRNLENGSSIVYLGAFDGKDFKRAWKTRALGPLGQPPSVALSGKLVGVTDNNNQLHVLELATGKTRAALQLSDKAKRLCANPNQAGQIWVEQVDEAHQIVDLKAGSKQAAPRPSWCPEDVGLSANSDCWGHEFRRGHHSRSTCMAVEGFAEAKGFKADYIMADGKVRVAMGGKHPGTAIPMAAGYSEDGSKVRWTRQLAAPEQSPADGSPGLADLIGSRVVFSYRTKERSSRLASFDAQTGKSLWDVAVPRSDEGSEPSTFRVTQSRVYVPHWTWLDIFESKTGKYLGTIGKW